MRWEPYPYVSQALAPSLFWLYMHYKWRPINNFCEPLRGKCVLIPLCNLWNLQSFYRLPLPKETNCNNNLHLPLSHALGDIHGKFSPFADFSFFSTTDMATCNVLPLFLLVVISALHHVQQGECDKMTLDKLGHKLDSLDEKLAGFKHSMDELDAKMTGLMNQYSLNIILSQINEAITARNEVGANKLWKIIRDSRNETTSILNSIIISSYSGVRSNILPLIRFISQSKDCVGYTTLFDEMEDYEHFYHGPEIFALCNSLLVNCGMNNSLFAKMPDPVRAVFKGPISLQNTFSTGFLFRKKDVQDSSMENHVATIRQPINTTINGVAIQNQPSDAYFYWSFAPSSEVAESFSMKSVNDYLVAGSSRRLHFTPEDVSKFILELNQRNEISIGIELEDHRGGGKKTFYRLYVQKQRLRNGDFHEINLWTIGPKDEYYKYCFWTVGVYTGNTPLVK